MITHAEHTSTVFPFLPYSCSPVYAWALGGGAWGKGMYPGCTLGLPWLGGHMTLICGVWKWVTHWTGLRAVAGGTNVSQTTVKAVQLFKGHSKSCQYPLWPSSSHIFRILFRQVTEKVDLDTECATWHIRSFRHIWFTKQHHSVPQDALRILHSNHSAR